MHRFLPPNKAARIHLIFGANTDVGKTVISAGLVQASLRSAAATAVFAAAAESTMTTTTTLNPSVYYIKPLQCGGSDESFIAKHTPTKLQNKLHCQTLFSWKTPASPHTACRLENLPQSDHQVLEALQNALSSIQQKSQHQHQTTTWLETAGGVLSPSSSSPDNQSPFHARAKQYANSPPTNHTAQWGWVTQGDLYRPLVDVASVILVGDGRLGGISATLSSLESLLVRGYNVVGIVMLATEQDNASAIREYVDRNVKLLPTTMAAAALDNNNDNNHNNKSLRLQMDPEQSIVSLPRLPPEPEPLYEWYQSESVVDTLDRFHLYLKHN